MEFIVRKGGNGIPVPDVKGPRMALFLNGDRLLPDVVDPLLEMMDEVIAVDGGHSGAISRGVQPLFTIGDLDSYHEEKRKEAVGKGDIIRMVDRDTTDLQKALGHIRENMAGEGDRPVIYLLDAVSDEVDHVLGNLAALQDWIPGMAFLMTPRGWAFLLPTELGLMEMEGVSISLIPMGPVQEFSEQGLRWSLGPGTHRFSPRGLHNTIIHDRCLIHHRGGPLYGVVDLLRPPHGL